MNVHTVEARLPCEVASRPVFSSDGKRLFALSQSGELVCVHIPSTATEPVGIQVEPRVDGRAFVAAGWIEGRLATITAGEGELRLSHGEYGVVGEPNSPSSPATLPLDGSGMPFGSNGRLDPYVRWFCEFNPIEVLVGGISLVRGDDDALHWVSAWRGDGGRQEVNSGLVAERVTALAGDENLRLAVFAGRVEHPVADESRRGHHRAPEWRAGVFVLAQWCADPARWLRLEEGSSIAFTAVSTLREGYEEVVAAGPMNGRHWRIFSGNPRDENPKQADIDLSDSETVAGVVRTALGPALVTLDANDRALYVVSYAGRTLLVRAPEPVTHVTVHYSTSWVACAFENELRVMRVG